MLNLKSIELYGFKSFAEKTKLVFDQGITAIVGPNGCGKSNLVDAFRWCLGEQSAHSLRSKQMLDVIFNGSQNRPPTNMVEISLTFDNSNKILPLDYTEVTVTRRLFRNGESEYYINKIQCRLKDIKELFLDTGIGTGGYAVFEQGRVEFIINSKPEERRELFEEASGIAKYKARREETLHKLEKVKQDMLRVNDIINVIKEQIDSLESAARKARLYKKYQEELRTLEISDLVKKISLISVLLTELKNDYEKVNKEYIEHTTKYNSVEAEIQDLKLKLTEFESKYFDIQQQINQIDTGIVESETKIKSVADFEKEYEIRKNTLKQNLEKLNNEKNLLYQMISELEKKLNELKNFRSDIETKLKQKEETLNNIEKNINNKKNETEEINNQIFLKESQKTKLNNEIVKLNAKEVELQTNYKNFVNEQKKLQVKKELLLSEITELKKNYDSLISEKEKLNKEIETINNNILTAKEYVDSITEEYDKLKEKIISINSKIETFKQIEKTDPKLRAIKMLIENKLPGIKFTVADIIEIQPTYENIVLNAFGDKLNYLICDSVENALNGIEFLKNNKLFPLSFIIMNKIPETSLKQPIQELNDIKPLKNVINTNSEYEKIIDFLVSGVYFSENNNIYTEAIITGGYTEEGTSKFMSFIELKQYEKELKDLQEKLKNIEINQEKKKQEFQDINSKKEIFVNNLRKIEFDINSLQNDISQKQELLNTVESELNFIKKELEQNQSEQNSISQQTELLKNNISEIDIQENKLRADISNIKQELHELENRKYEFIKEYNEVKNEFIKYEERTVFFEKELNKTKYDYSNTESRINNYRNELIELDNKIKLQKQIYDEETKKIDEFDNKRKELLKQNDSINFNRNTIYKKITDKENFLHEIKSKLDELQVKLHEKDVLLKTKQVEENTYIAKLKEYNVEYKDIKDDYINIEVEPETILKLKRKIETFGSVNLTAPEEYANLQERHNWLLTQQQDLLKSEQNLREAIYKINANIKENFKETFNKVRENFINIFAELFQGGEVDLILTDENDLLESGVDIIAQPLGKKPQHISLLSGGEKALIAIALLFAFYLVKPSPICILDEVDAPLDESNIVRFINLIKKFSQNSQFIIITHNRRTIEISDVIYGTTMEELGVSKIISIKLVKPQENEVKKISENIPQLEHA